MDGGRIGTAQVLVAALSRQPANQAAGKPSTTPHARSQPAEASMRQLASRRRDVTAQHLSLATPAEHGPEQALRRTWHQQTRANANLGALAARIM